ncbi:hypothetical protein AGABI2DRAFT_195487 [Agaricus bisporus var. bisporus H97]|uniref:hypothetical protein n=1 Tax=Agaricus bisporus var. bisporus (strain H97 / ATCC MYA-4626 / FGSC 10389) TaxID=936046 RepID=UPI00029F60DC|nr:hypothetical protein AGABI2DRAFT_195487 [Agaricus bisporus var. bisporus H97]EKV43323.1 hypothetical protein AGABI2DRAFT_195487 [Agaricus bisporus var. bisporus H97]
MNGLPPSKLLNLNDDVLLTILQYCLPTQDPIQLPPEPQSQRLLLCRICHRIRLLIHSTSAFWTRFAIIDAKSGRHRGLYEEWLSRGEKAGNSPPISIENREEMAFSVQELEEFVLPYANRLFRLHVYLTYDALETLFTLSPPGSFPQLCEFWAQCLDFQQASILGVEPVFKRSPLEDFTLILGPPLHVRGLGISWHNLKALRLIATKARFFFPISWVHTILEACQSSLESCSLSLEPTTDPDLPRLELPRLESLSLNFRDSDAKTQIGILDLLSLPSLVSLNFSSMEGLAFNETCSSLKSFFLRSPNVRHLRFERTPSSGNGFGTSVNSLDLLDILNLLPTLQTIDFPKGPHTNVIAILEALLLRNICPTLEHVHFLVHNGLQVVRVIQVLWREAAEAGNERNLRTIKIVDPKLSWIGICQPSPREDPDITLGRKIIRELEGEGLIIQT